MARKPKLAIAKPTIAEVLEQFLADLRGRLAPGTLAKYENVLGLLQHSLNGYAYTSLDKAEAVLFDRFYKAEGAEHREFCEVFGPKHILPNVGEFLDYFMVRKVIAGKETLRMAGTVTKKLAKWLAEKGYVEGEDAEYAVERGGEAARDLPDATDLAFQLDECGAPAAPGEKGIEDHFTFTRVEPGRVWVADVAGRERGPIELPLEVTRRCKGGWTFSGVVAGSGGQWHIVEAWNVYRR